MTTFSYSHANIGYPNGETDRTMWAKLPGDDRGFLILDSEHWHVDYLMQEKPEGLHVLRAMTGKMDDAQRIATRTGLHFREFFWNPKLALQFRNEDNLNYERGDRRDDWDMEVMRDVYAKSSELYRQIAMILVRDMGCKNKLVFPPYAPGHYLQEMSDLWVPAAKQRWNDGTPVFPYIGFHQYGEPSAIMEEAEWFRATFPKDEGFESLLLEWHGDRWQNGVGAWENTLRQETETLAELADASITAYFFIGKWVPPAESWSNEWDIEGNDDRMNLFTNPPLRKPIGEPDMPVEPNHRVIFGEIDRVTSKLELPKPLLYALGEAESSLLQSFYKNVQPNVVRPANPSQYAAKWTDVSAGVFHQTVRWAVEYTSAGGGAVFPGPTKCTEIMDLYRYDVAHAADVAGDALARFLRVPTMARGVPMVKATYDEMVYALYRYNKPNAEPTDSVKKRYRDSLTEAIKFTDSPIGEEPPEVVVPESFEFHFGFKDLADQLGAVVVGEPMSNEIYVGSSFSYQFTTTGKMEYDKSANKAHFFAASLPG